MRTTYRVALLRGMLIRGGDWRCFMEDSGVPRQAGLTKQPDMGG
jgi:hypothetical protein